jgi:hypothetical protein
MSGKKKALIILAILGAVFILLLVLGVFMDSGDRPKPDKKTAEQYKDSDWKGLLEKPASLFTPSLSPDSLHHSPAFGEPGKFSIEPDGEKAFRTLKLSLERGKGYTGWPPLSCTFSYKNSETSIEELRDQSDSLKEGESTTIVVLKEGGTLTLQPSSGCRVLMAVKGKTVAICENKKGCSFTVEPMFRR